MLDGRARWQEAKAVGEGRDLRVGGADSWAQRAMDYQMLRITHAVSSHLQCTPLYGLRLGDCH